MGRSITLMCRANGLGTLVYSWERRRSGSSWTTVSNDNTTSYTTDTTLTIGEYMYRCNVSNEAGSVVSNSATVNVYGEYSSAGYCVCVNDEVHIILQVLQKSQITQQVVMYQWEEASLSCVELVV